MPIPETFDEWGNLPQGVHDATLAEVKARFATNKRRRNIFDGLERVVAELATRGVKVLWVDGSYVTAKLRPSDVDVVFKPPPSYGPLWNTLYVSEERNRQMVKASHWVDLLPSHAVGEITPGLPPQAIVRYFQKDRDDRPKGIVRVKLTGSSP